jgi:8-oxo-dGTP pyrophosphatase MutT (NUDIX family)
MPPRKQGARPALPVRRQVSSGGVAFRRISNRVEVAIIRPRGTQRWQLPKGLVDPAEEPDQTARREVREEAGVDGDVVAPIEAIEYWYVGTDRDGVRVRFHKTVHFFLLAFRAGDVADHDHEVAEALWVPIDDAIERLAFRNEKAVVEKAREMIGALRVAG